MVYETIETTETRPKKTPAASPVMVKQSSFLTPAKMIGGPLVQRRFVQGGPNQQSMNLPKQPLSFFEFAKQAMG